MSLSIEGYISSPAELNSSMTMYLPTYFTFYVHPYIHYSVIQDKKMGVESWYFIGRTLLFVNR